MNLAGFYDESISNGTGWRAVIFVSGCTHDCDGCQNKKVQDPEYGELFDAEKQFEIFSKIRDNIKSRGGIISGVTLSGGEPFQSAKGLITLVKAIRALGLDIWAYTGYTLEELETLDIEGAKELLSLVDVLVDGRFVKSLNRPNLIFRGSSNQRIIDMNKYRRGDENFIINLEEEF